MSYVNIKIKDVVRQADTALRAIHEHYSDLVPDRDPVGVVSILHGNHHHLATTLPTLCQVDIGDNMTDDQRGKYSALSRDKARTVWLALPTYATSAALADPTRWIFAGGVGTIVGEERIAVGFSGQPAAIDHLIACLLLIQVVPNRDQSYLARMVELPGYDPLEILNHLRSLCASTPAPPAP